MQMKIGLKSILCVAILAAFASMADAKPKAPGGKQACLDTHKTCVDKCIKEAPPSDANCAVRCRQAYDRCKKGTKTRA